ncbi:MAG: PhnA domain-containing protein [Planctomycetota bacterium]|nr:PhnA domain-containing protein [Planctomycetota bacterium]
MTACALCSSNDDLSEFTVVPKDVAVDLCGVCHPQVSGEVDLDENHWRCLNDSMWSEVPAVQVLAWRMLNKLSATDWAGGLLEMLYLDDTLREWAEYQEVVATKHVDSLGAELSHGDGVVLIKDLDVKGGGFTAKRGTAVKSIRLVENNHEHIEGRVSGQKIVILTKFVKKQ